MDEITFSRLCQLLDKYFDYEGSKKKYFNVLSNNVKRSFEMSRENVNELIKDLKAGKHGIFQSKYDVVRENGVDTLIVRRKGVHIDLKYRKVMVIEDSYDILSEVHRKIGHKGYHEMYKNLSKKWFFPVSFGTAITSSCNVCKILNSVQFVREFVPTPETKDVWRLSFIDVEKECPYLDKPKHIMICEDVVTEFLILRPLTNMSIEEISGQILKVFFQFGAPRKIWANPLLIYEFVSKVLKRISNLHEQFQVATDGKNFKTEIKNSDIIAALQSWISEVESSEYDIDCELGCHVVQRKLNTRLRISNTKGTKKFQAFVPHNLFTKHAELTSNLWDDDVLLIQMNEDQPKIQPNKKRKFEYK